MSLELPVEQSNNRAEAPAKIPPGSLGEKKRFKTNAAEISLKPNLVIYKYDVDVNLVYENKEGKEVKKSLTKGAANDCLVQWRKKIANIALKKALDRKSKSIDLFYDSQATLYSTSKLENIIENISPKEVVPNDADCRSVEVVIKQVQESFQVSTNDSKLTVNPVFGKADVTLLEALNTIISQSLTNKDGLISYKGVHYALDPSRIGFIQRDLPAIPGGQYMGVGLAESVKTLEGDKRKTPQIYCISDIKKTAFHSDYQNLMDKFDSILRSRNEMLKKSMISSDPSARFLKSKVKGLAVRLNYGPNKNRYESAKWFIIGGFAETAAEQIVSINNEKMTVQQYFETKFGIKLVYPNFFTVYDKKNPKALFPPEVLIVGENQRVTTEQLTAEGQQEMVRASAILPSIREAQTKRVAEFVRIAGNNSKMEKVGITIEKNNVVVEGRVMPTPNISTGNGIATVINNSKWSVSKFKNGVKLPKWTLYSIDANIDVNIFLNHLRRRMVSSGMCWVDPKIVVIGKEDRFNLENIMASEKTNLAKLIFFVVRDSLNLHQEIKLFEQKYDMLTQEVRASTANNIVQRGQAQTVENIVNKMNMKLGGVNWEITGYNMTNKPQQPTNFLDPKFNRLIIGFESSRSIGDNLVCVGYSGNALPHGQSFMGNYKYVQNHKDVYGQVLQMAIYEMVEMFRVKRRAIPRHLYFYFNGISEGQMALVANSYVEKINAVCKKLDSKYDPLITIMCVSKCPNERIMNESTAKSTKAAEQNIPPGTCVDTVIVSPVVNEFFLNSHSAFQGSAKTPKFSQVHDTANLSMDFHEGMAHQLCFMHGIVSSSVSLPVPIMVADRYAKRGAANYQTSCRSDNRSTISGQSGESINLDDLNQKLSYSNKTLIGCRFNA